MKDTFECYKILGIEPGSSAKHVRAAYLDLVRVWDPDKHNANPTLRAETSKKRKEIDEAYEAIRFFLPELQGDQNDTEKPRLMRDFKEMTTEPPVEMTRAVLGFLVAAILVLIFAWSYYLYSQGHHVSPPPSVPLE
jgi:curved DNA-binding protein CbpA